MHLKSASADKDALGLPAAADPSQLYKRFLFQDYWAASGRQSVHPSPQADPLMTEFCAKVRGDAVLESIFRRVVEESLSFNSENAAFFADKLVSLTGDHPVAVYLLGETLFAAEEYVKVGHLFARFECLNLNENFAVLASKGFLRSKNFQAVIKTLTAPFTKELKNRVFATEIAFLVAKAQKMLENRQEAEVGFLNALRADPANHAAFQGLCETQQAEQRSLLPTIESLSFPTEALWLKKFYQTEVDLCYNYCVDDAPGAGSGVAKESEDSPLRETNRMQIEGFGSGKRAVYGNYVSPVGEGRQLEDPCPSKKKHPAGLSKSPERKEHLIRSFGNRDSENPSAQREEGNGSPEEERAAEVLRRLRAADNVHFLFLKLTHHFKNFQVNNAQEIAKKILERNQFHFETVLIYCEVLVEKEEIAELFSLSARLAESYPDHYVTFHVVGMYYFYLKKYEAARRYFNKAIHLNTYSLPTWLMLGHTYAAQEESDPASNVYRSALKLFPNSHLPHVYIGMEYLRINNLKTAAIAFNHAKRLAGDNPMIYNEIGCIFLKQKRFDAARKNFKRALRVCRANGINWLKHSILNNLANVHRKEKDYLAAIQYYEQALALCPNDPAVLFSLAFCYNLTGELNKAAGLYHKVISRKHDSHFVNHLLSKCMEDLATRNFDALR